jgi:hypothetical protein
LTYVAAFGAEVIVFASDALTTTLAVPGWKSAIEPAQPPEQHQNSQAYERQRHEE